MKFRPTSTKYRPNNHHHFGLVKLLKKNSHGLSKVAKLAKKIAQSGHPDAQSLSIPCL